MQSKIWQKPFSIRWGQNLWARILRWKDSSGWPLDTIMMRLLLLPLLPLYCWRLGFSQGLHTVYRILLDEGDFTIERHERDQGTAIRKESTDPWVFQQIFILDDYKKLAGKNDIKVIIDAGAYVGYSSMYLAELYPHAFIYALEPEESNFLALQRNTRHYPNIKPIQAALWKEEGYLEVAEGTSGQWSFQVKESPVPSIKRIPAITIKALMEQYRIPTIDILKIDIEGSEEALFEGFACHQWLTEVRYLVIELHDHLFPGSDANFKKAMERYPCDQSYAGENMIFDLESGRARNAAKITA